MMSGSKVSATYWTFTIITICTVGIFAYVLGRWIGMQKVPDREYVYEQPNIANDVFEQQINEPATPTNDSASEYAPNSENAVHSFTGYVRSIDASSITLENPKKTINDSHIVQFDLQQETIYQENQVIIENGKRDLLSTTLAREDIVTGDIITAYTREDILTADRKFITTVQRITAAPEEITDLVE